MVKIMDISVGNNLMTIWVVVAAVLCWIWLRRERSPPGPTLVPFLGIVPGIIGDLKGRNVSQWAKQFKSKVIQVKVLGQKIVVLCSLDLIKDVYVKRPDLADRIEMNNLQIVEPTHEGIIFSSGQVWRDTRRVILRRMRDFGMGGSSAESFITHECEMLISKMDEFKGEAFNPMPLLNRAVSNVINCFIFGKRFDYEDEKFIHSLECINQFTRASSGVIATYALRFKLGRWIFRKELNRVRVWWKGSTTFVDEQIKEHERHFDGTVNDLVDAFLDDIKNGEGKLDAKQVSSCMNDMFGAGSDTTMIQLQWLLLYMAKYPDVQQRVYDELNMNVTAADVPTMQNKKQTPYTEAVINEVMRLNILLEFGLPRTNRNQDFEIEGYRIKAGTPVVANYWAVQLDPQYFDHPNEFDPRHFLNENGELVNQDKMVSYTLGRRSCAGESLARMEIYLFFVMLILRFRVEPPEGVDVDLSNRKSSGLNQPIDFMIRMIQRKH